MEKMLDLLQGVIGIKKKQTIILSVILYVVTVSGFHHTIPCHISHILPSIFTCSV